MAIVQEQNDAQRTQAGFTDVGRIFQGWNNAAQVPNVVTRQQACAEILVRRNSLPDRGLAEVAAQLGSINVNHAICKVNNWACQDPAYPQHTLSLILDYMDIVDRVVSGLLFPLLTIMDDEVINRTEFIRTPITGNSCACEFSRKSISSGIVLRGETSIEDVLGALLPIIESSELHPQNLGLLRVQADFCVSWEIATKSWEIATKGKEAPRPSSGKKANRPSTSPAFILCAILAK